MPKIKVIKIMVESIGQTLANQIQIEKDILNSIEIKSFINEFDKSNSIIINLQLAIEVMEDLSFLIMLD